MTIRGRTVTRGEQGQDHTGGDAEDQRECRGGGGSLAGGSGLAALVRGIRLMSATESRPRTAPSHATATTGVPTRRWSPGSRCRSRSGSPTINAMGEVAAGVTTFILAGRWSEARAKRRAGAAVRALLEGDEHGAQSSHQGRHHGPTEAGLTDVADLREPAGRCQRAGERGRTGTGA